MVICIWFNRAVHVIMDYFPLLQKQKDVRVMLGITILISLT